MKKYYSLLFALLAVMAMALVFVSCNKETDYEEPKPESKNQITFTTEHPVGSKMWLFLKRGEQPTEVIGAKEIYDENPFDEFMVSGSLFKMQWQEDQKDIYDIGICNCSTVFFNSFI